MSLYFNQFGFVWTIKIFVYKSILLQKHLYPTNMVTQENMCKLQTNDFLYI